MRLYAILLVSFCCMSNFLLAQTKENFNIVSVIDKGSYFYIPKSVWADSVVGVIYQLKIDKNTNFDERPIKLYWISVCNNGYYDLTITPEQIFFSSSHDNPNPDYLFWVIDIDRLQYQQIQKGLKQKPPVGFEDLSKNYGESLIVFYDKKFKDTLSIPNEWNDDIAQQRDIYCKSQTNGQIKKYFSIINSYITKPIKKVSIPVSEMNPKYFSYSKNEIADWMPVKFAPPKIKD